MLHSGLTPGWTHDSPVRSKEIVNLELGVVEREHAWPVDTDKPRIVNDNLAVGVCHCEGARM